MSATVIIPTTGSPEVKKAIDSVLNQTYDTTCYVVCDGSENYSDAALIAIANNYEENPRFKFCSIPINVGKNGFYGHRIYAAFTHLINTDYVLYLDQDNWFDEDHVKTCVETIEKNELDWCYSLRKIHTKEGNYVCNDDCESLGKWKTFHNINHIDTNAYCLKTPIAIRLASVWHGGWGQDRVFYGTLNQHVPKYDCTRKYTLNYRVDGGKGSVTSDFFIQGNKIMNELYDGEFPWAKS
jgi:glycosyltransferase involved in cell wall biosynthesis